MRRNLEIQNDIFQYIIKNQGCSYTEIVENFQNDKKTIDKYIRYLKINYKIVKINERYYALPNEKDQIEFRKGVLHIVFYDIAKIW